MPEVAIGPITQIPKGEGRVFEVAGQYIVVFHTRGGKVFATQADCPHLGGPLADGLTDETTVVCPLHDRIFDFVTGGGIGTECAIAVFPVRVDDAGTILVMPKV
jgi:nitrite reductase (NADH) small subunit